MKNAYEEKITGEIRRTLRHLEEACAEQQVTMEQAVEWYRTRMLQNESISVDTVSTKEELSYRERVEQFVSQYVEGEEKDICVTVLCYMNGQTKCPTINQILEEVESKMQIAYISRQDFKRKVSRPISRIMSVYMGKEEHPGRSLAFMRKMLFTLAKSL